MRPYKFIEISINEKYLLESGCITSFFNGIGLYQNYDAYRLCRGVTLSRIGRGRTIYMYIKTAHQGGNCVSSRAAFTFYFKKPYPLAPNLHYIDLNLYRV